MSQTYVKERIVAPSSSYLTRVAAIKFALTLFFLNVVPFLVETFDLPLLKKCVSWISLCLYLQFMFFSLTVSQQLTKSTFSTDLKSFFLIYKCQI